MNRFRRARGRDDGVAAVEMALIAPILFLILFAIIQFGFIFGQHLALSNSARQAARFGAVPNAISAASPATSNCAAIFAEARNAGGSLGMKDTDIKVLIQPTSPSGAASGEPCSNSSVPTTSVDHPANFPCKGSKPGDAVTVETYFKGNFVFPFLPAYPTLTSTGVYQCEFH